MHDVAFSSRPDKLLIGWWGIPVRDVSCPRPSFCERVMDENLVCGLLPDGARTDLVPASVVSRESQKTSV